MKIKIRLIINVEAKAIKTHNLITSHCIKALALISLCGTVPALAPNFFHYISLHLTIKINTSKDFSFLDGTGFETNSFVQYAHSYRN